MLCGAVHSEQPDLPCGFDRDQPESNGGAFGFMVKIPHAAGEPGMTYDGTWGYLVGADEVHGDLGEQSFPTRDEAAAAAQLHVNIHWPAGTPKRVTLGVWRRPQIGPYLPMDVDDLVERAEEQAEEDGWYSGGEPLFSTKPHAKQAFEEMMNDWATRFVTTEGRYTLRDAEYRTLTSAGTGTPERGSA